MIPRLRRYVLFILSLTLLLSLSALGSARAQTDQRCFPETNYCIAGRIHAFWEHNGGLPVFGYPTGPQQDTVIEDKSFQAQTFERNRLELHPENQSPYDVLLGRLGVDRLTQQGRNWFTFPKGQAQDGCRFFPAVGHTICGDVLTAWHANRLDLNSDGQTTEDENLALFGLPISELQTETIQGKEYQVQWFERARFELHPENQPPYNVLLGLLGNEIRETTPAFTPSPAPAVTATPMQTGTIVVTHAPGTVRRGNVATVSIRTTPGVTCDITVEYKSGPSRAQGLYPKQADSNGEVSWSWIVGTRTTPGSWPVIITCGNQTVNTEVTVP